MNVPETKQRALGGRIMEVLRLSKEAAFKPRHEDGKRLASQQEAPGGAPDPVTLKSGGRQSPYPNPS